VNFWNYLDVTIIALFVYKIVLIWQHVSSVNPMLDELRQVKNVYRETYWLASSHKREALIAGIIVLASWIKV